MKRKGGLKAGVNNPKTRHGKMAFFDEGGSTVAERERKYMDPTKLEDEAKSANDDLEVKLDADKTKRRSNLSKFGAAFASARARKLKDFSYFGDEKHKEGKYTTGLKGESKPAASRPAPPRSAPPAAPAETNAAKLARRHTENVARETEFVRNRNRPTVQNASRATATAAVNAVRANRTSSDAATRMRQAGEDWKAGKDKATPSLRQVAAADIPDVPYNPSAFERGLNIDPNIRAITGMAKGGSVGKYSKMEKEHVAQMKKHGVPEKYVKQEEKEAMGMKCGGKVMKYAKGGGIESKGKTQGKMVRMASGGSVSSRADGIASRGKTNCKMR